jgi:DNA-directed RNA polymerase specialized sigma24 family protein
LLQPADNLERVYVLSPLQAPQPPEGAMADDARSFDEFYRATSRRLMHFAYAMTGDLATAQDLTQDAYMRAWRHWQHVGSLDRPESWLRVRIQIRILCRLSVAPAPRRPYLG